MSIAFVPLTKGYAATIDEPDLPLVSQYSWNALVKGNSVYARTEVKDENGRPKAILLHRLIMAPPIGMWVDHINHDGLNCRRENMRIASPGQNTVYSRRAIGKSGFRGVHRNKGLWAPKITVGYKTIHGKSVPTPEEAARAYDEMALKHFGSFAKLNFPIDAAMAKDPQL